MTKPTWLPQNLPAAEPTSGRRANEATGEKPLGPTAYGNIAQLDKTQPKLDSESEKLPSIASFHWFDWFAMT